MITIEQRAEAVRQYFRETGERFTREGFLRWARALGPGNPVYDRFEWDDKAAAHEYRLQQVGHFVSDLRIEFRAVTVTKPDVVMPFRVEAPVKFPMMMSPRHTRDREGGHYVLFDPTDDDHLREWCGQAADTLRAWRGRHAAALTVAGVPGALVDSILARLDGFSSVDGIAAE
jgi:hypothetical protein